MIPSGSTRRSSARSRATYGPCISRSSASSQAVCLSSIDLKREFWANAARESSRKNAAARACPVLPRRTAKLGVSSADPQTQFDISHDPQRPEPAEAVTLRTTIPRWIARSQRVVITATDSHQQLALANRQRPLSVRLRHHIPTRPRQSDVLSSSSRPFKGLKFKRKPGFEFELWFLKQKGRVGT